MEDSQRHVPFLNPCVLHLQKLALELKCSCCLNLYTKPLLLPCNHIFCSSCVSKSDLSECDCPLCNRPYTEQELRQAPYIENVVNIYRCLDASFSLHMLKSGDSDKKTSGPSPLGNSDCGLSKTLGTQRTANKVKGCGFADSELKIGFEQQDFQTFESNTSFLTSRARAIQQEKKVAESSPNITPYGVGKDRESDVRDAGSTDENAKIPENKSAKRKVDDLRAKGVHDSPSLRLKKQNQLNQDLPERHDSHLSPLASTHVQNSVSSASDPKACSSSGGQLAFESDCISLVNFACAFCQTWKISDGSGPIEHFANGKQVSGSEAGRPDAIHAHKSCIYWAPRIYFESNNEIKNLDKEIARSEKLKCSSCGLKGASLGCYAKNCRRSYHVPCAYEITECRWSTEGYNMLCPSHSSQKFPSEKSKKHVVKKCTKPTLICDEQKNTHEPDFLATSPVGAKNWVLCGSALSTDEKFMLVEFAKVCGATLTNTWNPNVTHVIATIDENGACDRTFKVLMATLKGKWILKTDWVKASMQSKSPVDEQSYEISLDIHGCRDGPKTGRLRVFNNEPQLFKGLRFFFTRDFKPSYKNDIQELILAGGGTIIASIEELKRFSTAQSTIPCRVLVVHYNDDMTGTEGAQVEDVVESGSHSQAVSHTWILGSIASGVLQPFTAKG